MHPIWRILTALLLALGLACGGSSKTPPSTPPLAPAQFRVDGVIDTTVYLSWTNSNSLQKKPIDGFELEARVNGGPFQSLSKDLVDARAQGCIIAFSKTVPELTTVDFRIRCKQGNLASDWVVASYTYAMVPPYAPGTYYFQEQDGHPAHLRLSWVVQSLIAETTTLYRRVIDSPERPWAQLVQVARDVTSWEDPDAPEGTPCEYGFRHEASGKPSSITVVSSKVVVPCLNPQNLRGTWTDTGLDLRWDVRSATATQQSIYRFQGDGSYKKIADLDGTTSKFHDPDPPSGLNWYWIETSNQVQGSLNQSNRLLVPPPTMAGLRVSTLAQGTPICLTRQSDGVWWLAHERTTPTGVETLQSIGAVQNVSLPLPPIHVSQLQMDSNDSMHWMGWYDDLSHKTGHAWISGGVLQSENLDALMPNGMDRSNWEFHIGADAKLHLFAQEPHAYSTPSPIVHLQKSQGGWSQETLKTPWDPNYLPVSGVAEDGTILMIPRSIENTQCQVAWWKPSGETGVDGLPGTTTPMEIIPTPWGETYLLCSSLQGDGTQALQFFHGQPGNWQGSETLSESNLFFSNASAWVVDGIQKRILFLVEGRAGAGSQLVTFQEGKWTTRPLGCSTTGPCWAGTGSGGKFWLAFKVASDSRDTDPILVLEDF